jgi:hypothetical protein
MPLPGGLLGCTERPNGCGPRRYTSLQRTRATTATACRCALAPHLPITAGRC